METASPGTNVECQLNSGTCHRRNQQRLRQSRKQIITGKKLP
jgi:hypothetical protein